MLIYRLIVIFISLTNISHVFARDCKELELQLQRGQELFNRGQYLLSSIHYSNGIANKCQNIDQYKYHYSLSMIHLLEFQDANLELNSISKKSPYFKKAKILKRLYLNSNIKLSQSDTIRVNAWQNKNNLDRLKKLTIQSLSTNQQSSINRYIEHLENQDLASPYLSGSLSLVPGLGQAYLGAYQSAAISFVLNSLFYLSAKDFEEKGQYNSANAAYLVFSITYIGNILNCVNMAKKINQKKLKPYREELKKDLFSDLY